MDERLQFVARRPAGEAMAELCREFGKAASSAGIAHVSTHDAAYPQIVA